MRYIGNKYKNMDTLYFFLVFVPIAIYLSIKIQSVITFFVTVLIGYFLFSLNSYYFIIDTEYLFIQNYLFPLLHKKFKIKDIVKINIDATGKYSFSKACIKIDSRKKMYLGYPGVSLTVDDWIAFIKELKSYGLKVSVDPRLKWYYKNKDKNASC